MLTFSTDELKNFSKGILLFLLPIVLCAQTPDFSFQNLGRGMLKGKNHIMYLQKDSRGFVWIGTDSGVLQYDGLKIKDYNLGSNVQSSFYEDKKGNMWFSTYTGIYCYIRKEGTFKTYHLISSFSGDTITKRYRVFHLQFSLNKLWVKAGEEIFILDTNNPDEYEPFPYTTRGEYFSVDTTKNGYVKRIYACPWILEPGIEIFSKSNSEWVRSFALNESDSNQSFSPPEISQAIIENDTLVWLVSNQGLLLFNNKDQEIVNVFNVKSSNVNFIRGTFWDSTQLLLSTDNNGFWLFHTKDTIFKRNWVHIEEIEDSPSSDKIMTLYLDAQKHLWVLHKYSGIDYSKYVKQPFNYPLEDLTINPANVKFIIEDNNGKIWAGTRKQGIFIFDQNEQLLRHFPYNSKGSNPMDINILQHLSRDDSGKIWCMSRHKLFVFENESWREITFPDSVEIQFFFLFHSSDEIKLLVTNKGLINITFQDSKEVFEPILELQTQNIEFIQVFKNLQGHLFIPYNGDKLLVHQNGLDSLSIIEGIKDSKGFFYRFSPSLSHDTTWVGSSNGLILIDHPSEGKHIFQEEWELGNCNVYGLTYDHQGNWWLPTNQGLWAYYPMTKRLVQFRNEDGLYVEDFSPFAALKASNNKLWFGHNKGLVVFHPDSIHPYPFPPAVKIEKLLINNNLFTSKIDINETEEIILNHYENSLSFELIAIGNHLPHLSKLSFRLLNYNNNWSTINNGGLAPFNKIPYGQYTFEIVARDVHGLTSSKKLKIKIKSPLYLRWWFICLSILVGTGILWVILNSYRKRREKIQQLKFENIIALEKERLRIARDMHDDLGSGLSTLSLLVKIAQQKKPDNELNEELEKLSTLTDKLTQKVREVIWSVTAKNDSLEKLVVYFHQYASDLFDNTPIECLLSLPDKVPNSIISGKNRRLIFLTFKEALNNIIKHSNATKTIITIDIGDNQLLVSIEDNGKGFDPVLIKLSSGNGLLNMQERMKEIGGLCNIHTNSKGTSVILTFSI